MGEFPQYGTRRAAIDRGTSAFSGEFPGPAGQSMAPPVHELLQALVGLSA